MPQDADVTAPPKRASATAGALLAMLIWSTSVAVVRGMMESLGFTGAAMAFGAGGGLALALAWIAGRSPAAMFRLGPKYLLGCGGLFATYIVCIYAALGWAPDHSTTLVVGVLNYLWAPLMVVLAVPILHRRARWPLVAGCLMALAGSAAATLGGEEFSWAAFGAAGWSAALPLVLAVVAAVAWGLYSNFTVLWGRPDTGAVPLFVLACAAAFAAISLTRDEAVVWTHKAGVEFGTIVLMAAVAYPLWERGTRAGNQRLLGLVSLGMPVFAIALAAAYFGVRPGASLIVGCLLVAGGAAVCRFSLRE